MRCLLLQIILGEVPLTTRLLLPQVTDDNSGEAMTFYSESGVRPGGAATFSLLVKTQYEVAVKCADVRGNGTDGRLLVRLLGEKGSSQAQLLSSAGDSYERDFERGSTGRFIVECMDLGKVKEAEVTLSDQEVGATLGNYLTN